MVLYQVLSFWQSGPRSNVNEGVLSIPQSPSITGTSPSDCLVSYPGHSLRGGGNLTPRQRSSQCILRPPADWAKHKVNVKTVLFQIIQFSISTQIKGQNSSISSNSVEHKYSLNVKTVLF